MFFDETNGVTDGQTDGPTDAMDSYQDARTQDSYVQKFTYRDA